VTTRANQPTDTSPTAIVLAAGKGTRMRSERAKVLHSVAGRSMLRHVLQALADAGTSHAVVVIGHQADQVTAEIESHAIDGLVVTFAHQEQQRGTGHAVLQARSAIDGDAILVVNGDLPLLTGAQVRAVHGAAAAKIVVAAMTVADPTGLGRIVRSADGSLAAIVEQADADDATAAIHEINAGIYRFDAAALWPALESLPESASGEIYLTDAIAQVAQQPGDVVAVAIDASEGPLHVDTQRDLARAEDLMRARIAFHWMDQGVTIRDPRTTHIDADVRIGRDTVLEAGTHLRGSTQIGTGCQIGPTAVIRDSVIGNECMLEQCTISEATLANHVEVGPYSTVRAGTELSDNVHLGTHAEIKNARLGPGTLMGHFSYVGDADVGAGSNIGAGAITCNFDGEAKHRTTIGKRVFIGSDTLLIAPVTLGDDASTGAGSVVNKDVPAGTRVVGHPARTAGRKSARRTTRDAAGDKS
jgi:bifunctional UDP-N-acetylglucosamine pyrophosphorylase/glucosamine-1-phosphate N-acetyltransferase